MAQGAMLLSNDQKILKKQKASKIMVDWTGELLFIKKLDIIFAHRIYIAHLGMRSFRDLKKYVLRS